MTALAALIQHCECPTVIKVGETVVYDSWIYFASMMDWYTFSGEAPWYSPVVDRIKSQQIADGIPVRTIQEAIDAGEYLLCD